MSEKPTAAETGLGDARSPNLNASSSTECYLTSCSRFANKTTYVLVYGFLGLVAAASSAYANSTLTTLEKRFKMSSRTTGIISVGNDVSSMLITLLMSYYAGKGHRPRWIAVGMYFVAFNCFLRFLPHLIWGPGDDALALTLEFGGSNNATLLQISSNRTATRSLFCQAGNATASKQITNVPAAECIEQEDVTDSSIAPAVIFFVANFISGIGGSLFYTLGVTYMDDNSEKAKTPFLLSLSYFMSMLGPALGYAVGSFCLKFYIAPFLSPVINNDDTRWIGAWWAGWLFFGVILTVTSSVIGLFPRELPVNSKKFARTSEPVNCDDDFQDPCDAHVENKASLQDMKQTIERLMTNKIFVCNTLAAIFYLLGFTPFLIFMPKYLEMQYRISSSSASFFTGSVGLVWSALGILIAGFVISRFKPRARYLAGWNVVVSTITVIIVIGNTFLGCEDSDLQSQQMKATGLQECNSACNCDFVKYAPVCSEDGLTTFISACHAGCTEEIYENGKKVFIGCACIAASNSSSFPLKADGIQSTTAVARGRAFPGTCPVNCQLKFYVFVAIICVFKFCSASGRASNFLVSVRCVEERDKATSMGLGVMLFNIFVFIPAPIIFGYIIDTTCVVWGKTCTGSGNCWQYDAQDMRNLFCLTAASFVAIGTLFDIGVWFNVKHLQVFDDDDSIATQDVARLSEIVGETTCNFKNISNGLANPVYVHDEILDKNK